MSSVVGFDFGNMNCYISVARQGGIDVLTNDYSLHATPSCVAFGQKNRVMGVAARQQVFTNFKNTVLNFKHFLGRKYNDPVVQQIKEFVPCDVVELPNGNIGFKVNYLSEDRIFSTEQITASFLFKLKQITETQIGQKVTDCVISVPFFFTDLQRRALLAASKIAGLNVLKLVHESTSIGIAYGIYKSGLLPPEAEPAKIVAFVDVGHSTVQATLASFHERKLTILGSTFDLTVGGMHFDAVIRDHFRQELIQNYKIDPKSSPKHWLRLLDECEKLKKQMSANVTAIPFHIECFMNDKDVSGKMARAQFEELAEPLFAKIRTLLTNLLKETGVQAKDVSEVELIGGSSRIPFIKQIVAHLFNREPKTTMNQDEAVARGAGMMCAILSPSFKVKEFNIKDYVPFDIKLVYQGAGGGKAETTVFKQAEDFPFAKMLTLMKTESFSVVGMYEKPNEIPFPDTYIGSWEVRDVTPLNGEPRKIKAKLRMDGHGIFSLASATTTEELPPEEDEPMEPATEAPKDQPMADGTGEAQQNENSQNNGSQKEGEQKQGEKKEKKPRKITTEYPIVENVPFTLNVDECILAEQEMQARDFEVKATADAKNAVEEFCYSMRDKISGELAEFVLPEEIEIFQSLLQATEDWLYDEGEDAEKPVYVHRLNELKGQIETPILERYQKKVQEERSRKEAEEKAKAAAAEAAKGQPAEEKMDESGDSPQVNKEKSPKGKK